jgi:hypothetical protein
MPRSRQEDAEDDLAFRDEQALAPDEVALADVGVGGDTLVSGIVD